MRKIVLIFFLIFNNQLVAQTIVASEYYWDTDPGIGAGIPISGSSLSSVINLNINSTTTGLSAGTHYLYIRSKDNTGKWSISEMRAVTIVPSIISAEYFWDNDPGIGAATGISITIDDSLDFSPAFSTTNLPVGTHYLYLRTKSSTGQWSLSEGRPVNIISSIVAAEYFWDTDPGNGMGTPVSVTLSDSVNFNPVVSTSGLSSGTHHLYIRTKDNSGKWSLPEGRAVTITPSIVAAEYFWDTDPGVGSGNSLGVSPDDSLDFNVVFNTSGFSNGSHTLYIRTKDNTGKWSLSEARSITIIPSVTAAEYFWDTDPGTGLATALTVSTSDSVNFQPAFSTNGLNTGLHYLHVRTRNNTGNWSLTEARPVSIIQGIVAAEYFWNTDPGIGAGTAIPVSSTDSLNLSINFVTTGLSTGTHTLYVRTKDNSGKWSLSEPRTITIAPAALTLSVYLQGLYIGGGMMTSALFNSYAGANPEIADSITIRLFSPANLNTPSFLQKTVVYTNGTVNLYLPDEILGGTYYVVVNHRNSLETWSKVPVVINSTQVNFDFSHN